MYLLKKSYFGKSLIKKHLNSQKSPHKYKTYPLNTNANIHTKLKCKVIDICISKN